MQSTVLLKTIYTKYYTEKQTNAHTTHTHTHTRFAMKDLVVVEV